ncbi:MAG TPA: RdgB/HAM1 family non-canonical purine NTP pyrophosphatase [Acidimicrobiia bacterium]|nr:RdgB/HAM1 family non-canonical purine NTP pyrophosphatase [Acidimicrobiia bacterium]
MNRPHGVVVASKNPDKITEIEAVLAGLDPPVVVIPGHVWDDVDETEETLEANALIKARAVAAATGHAAIADDTGLEVDALGGAPGVRTARYAGEAATYEDNVARLLSELEGVADRSATFRTAIALATPGGDSLVFEGSIEGRITNERRGEGGFGYDPVFEVEGRTLAEMGSAQKNAISHRAKALRALADALNRS